KEYLNKEMKDYAESQGTLFEQTAPHSSAQNGVAECLNRTLMDYARAMLFQHKLPKYLWQEAVAHSTYVRNRLPTRATRRTPFEMFFGKGANWSQLEEFGADLWVLDQSGKVRKLDEKARKYKFMGFGDNSRAYRYWKPETRQVLLSRNVVFSRGVTAVAGDDDDEEEDDDQLVGG